MIELRKLLAYEAWASRRLLNRLRTVPDLDPQVWRLFAPIQMGLKVWIVRIRGADSRELPIWPGGNFGGSTRNHGGSTGDDGGSTRKPTLEELEQLIDENEQAYAELFADASEDLLRRQVRYTNQHGLSYETAVGDILWHVATHGGYHRGQIAKLLRDAGAEPVNTDYITFVRELAGQPWKP